MRVTNCPDCGEVVEIPPPTDEDDDTEVTCQICGLSGPASEWQTHAPEDDESLLGRLLPDATIPASVPKSWALRVEQLEDIREVVIELAHQIRLLRQALDEFNQDLPEIVKRWIASLQSDSVPTSPPVPIAARSQAVTSALPTSHPVCESAALPQPASDAKTREPQGRRKAAAARTNQSGLW